LAIRRVWRRVSYLRGFKQGTGEKYIRSRSARGFLPLVLVVPFAGDGVADVSFVSFVSTSDVSRSVTWIESHRGRLKNTSMTWWL